jgi:hypothetical protein
MICDFSLVGWTRKQLGPLSSDRPFIVGYVIILIIGPTVCAAIPLLNMLPPVHMSVCSCQGYSGQYCLSADLRFNGKCREWIAVSGYQTMCSLSIAFNIVLGRAPSIRAAIGWGVVILGLLLGAGGMVKKH